MSIPDLPGFSLPGQVTFEEIGIEGVGGRLDPGRYPLNMPSKICLALFYSSSMLEI